MSDDEVLACARVAVQRGYGTVVLQSGEDPGLGGEWVAALVRRITRETPLAVTLSMGERSLDDLRAWREAGADRYLLKFETSNRALYDALHPPLPGTVSDRVALLRALRGMGYETGSGAMIGLPGQTYEDLANDILLFRELDLDMIGVGPYIPHPATPLGVVGGASAPTSSSDEVPNSELMGYKVVALTRIVCPLANIPSTTALATVSGDASRQLGLERGANVVMPNLTPPEYRVKYDIYPSKGRTQAAADDQGDRLIREGIAAIGRKVGVGRGDSLRRHRMSPR
jgi:biotin synthase